MANEPIITIVGNLAADAELRFTTSGVAVAKFRMAHTPRVKDGEEWKDGEAQWYTVTVWREYGENVAETLRRGMRVIVTGRLSFRTWETDAGESRLSHEIDADAVGLDLRYVQVKPDAIVKKTKGGGNSGGGDAWAGASKNRPASGGQPTANTQRAAAQSGQGDEAPPW